MVTYRGRRAYRIENDILRVTVLEEGGHVAEIFHKPTGVNPLWTPPWPSIEPSSYDPAKHPEYGDDAESRTLAGLMGHNACIDLFGAPTPAEAAAGMAVHGEASILPYSISVAGEALTQTLMMSEAQLRFSRRIRLVADGGVEFEESLENLTSWDRPVAWTEHVTLGPPFLQGGETRFRVPATRSQVIDQPFGEHAYMKQGAEFMWPQVPLAEGGTEDLSIYTARPISGGFTTHLLDPGREEASFIAWSPRHRLAIGYAWSRADFPWLGLWEENRSRATTPWNGETITRGLEFGVSPFPCTRREMIERGPLFDTPTMRWIPARETVRVRYRAQLQAADTLPETI